jgi:hypothetical protein
VKLENCNNKNGKLLRKKFIDLEESLRVYLLREKGGYM